MKEIRKQIDEIDKNIIKLLSRRFKLAPKLAKFKKAEGLPILDKKRELEVIDKLEKLAKKEGLDLKFIKKLWVEILKESRKIQHNK
ncbi:chorismate mutase [Patescibacteria group bacterium]|nr:chorismate mutase [Patescibacteria group bacterium]